jgi:hypothetical protein
VNTDVWMRNAKLQQLDDSIHVPWEPNVCMVGHGVIGCTLVDLNRSQTTQPDGCAMACENNQTLDGGLVKAGICVEADAVVLNF